MTQRDSNPWPLRCRCSALTNWATKFMKQLLKLSSKCEDHVFIWLIVYYFDDTFELILSSYNLGSFLFYFRDHFPRFCCTRPSVTNNLEGHLHIRIRVDTWWSPERHQRPLRRCQIRTLHLSIQFVHGSPNTTETILMNSQICHIIKFSTSDNAFRVLWLVHSILVISSYTLVWPYMVNDCAERR